MAIIGIQTNKNNPEFNISDFTFWMPQFKKYMETQDGIEAFNRLYAICNKKVYYSIFGSDWQLAMSLAIAHYLTEIAKQQQTPDDGTLAGIAGTGTTQGVLSSMSIGSFSKSYDLGRTMLDDDTAKFWNSTPYGAKYYALLKSKPIASLFVVTQNPIVGAN